MTERCTVDTDMMRTGSGAGSGSADRHLPPEPTRVAAVVVEYRRLTYRALVLQSMHTTLPPVWQAVDEDGTDLLALAVDCACVGPENRPCRHRDVCLAAAVWLDIGEEWAAGVDRAGRVEYFAELERVACGVDPWIASQRPGIQQSVVAA